MLYFVIFICILPVGKEKKIYFESNKLNRQSFISQDHDNQKKEELACGEWNNDFVELNGGGVNGVDAKEVLDDVNRNVVMID